MHVTLDLASRRVDDEADLLFQVRRRQERRLLRVDLGADDVRERLAVRGDVFDMFHLADSTPYRLESTEWPCPRLRFFKNLQSSRCR